MYPVVVTVHCTDRRCESRTVCRRIELPFVPAPRLVELGFVAPEQDHHWSGEIDTAIYDVGQGVFHVELVDWISSRLLLSEMLADLGPEWQTLEAA